MRFKLSSVFILAAIFAIGFTISRLWFVQPPPTVLITFEVEDEPTHSPDQATDVRVGMTIDGEYVGTLPQTVDTGIVIPERLRDESDEWWSLRCVQVDTLKGASGIKLTDRQLNSDQLSESPHFRTVRFFLAEDSELVRSGKPVRWLRLHSYWPRANPFRVAFYNSGDQRFSDE